MGERGGPAEILFRAECGAEGRRDAQQRRMLMRRIADALHDSGFTCELIMPGTDEEGASAGRRS